MNKYKRIIYIIMLAVISLSNLSAPAAYAAQVAVSKLPPPASNKLASPAPPPHFYQPDSSSVLGASTSLLTVGTQSSNEDGTLGSAGKRIPIRMQQLAKRVYQTDEDVMLAVTNPDNDSFSTAVLNAKGQGVNVPITETNDGTTTNVQIQGSNEILPGKYMIKVTDDQGDSTTQDFSWGVLALNTDKTMYHPGETGDISIGVLNDQGDMVCDSSVQLQIINAALGVNEMLSTGGTGKDQIIINPQCQKHDFSLQPDYQAQYTFNKAGTYTLQLTASTENGVHTITDTIPVTNDIPFDVQRVSATRIYPPNTYPMTVNIKANRDFSGTVTETVPEDFVVTPATESATPVTSYANLQTVYLNSNDPAAQLEQAITASGSGGLVMPFHGYYPITQGFGAQMTDPTLQAFYTQYGLAGHDGVDFGVPMDTPLYAVDDGNVTWSGPGDYGVTIIIQQAWGESYYGHLSTTAVNVGTHVTKGELIGYSGESGEATGPHLHFGIRPNNPDMNNGYYGKVDPLPYLPYNNQQPQDISTLDPTLAQAAATQTVLSASTSATPSPSTAPVQMQSSDASASAAVSSTLTPATIMPSVTPTPSTAISESPTIFPSPTEDVQEAITVSTTPPANTNFTVLDKQIALSEELANSSQTGQVKVLTWNVTLKKGETTSIGYDYQTPRASPQFYLLGPIQFYQNGSNKVIFQEQRQWELASDDVGVEWYSNTKGNTYNGYSWQYRKKIDISSNEVVATPSAATVDFMDSGGDAVGNNLAAEEGFYTGTGTSSGGSISINTTSAETGSDSLQFNSGSNGFAGVYKNGVLSDSGNRISAYVNFASFPSNAAFLCDCTINVGAAVFQLAVTSLGVLQVQNNSGTQIGSNGPTLSTNTWYRVAMSYVVTSTTNYSVNVYVNGALAINYSQASGGTALSATGSNALEIGWGGSAGTNNIVNIDDIYADSGTDLSDPGNVHVTAKRPDANGTSNQLTTQIGAGGSGFGSGHTPQVNERPLSTLDGWSLTTGTTAGYTEEYNIESASSGDVNLTGDTILGYTGWVDISNTDSGEANFVIVNGTSYSAGIVNITPSIWTGTTTSSTYPAGTGSDIGTLLNKAVTGSKILSIYEAGVQVAYLTSKGSLTNFPVEISLSGDTSLGANAQSSGNDIVFTDSTGENLLSFEIESYSVTSGAATLVAWVNIPTLSAATDTIIYMYYGNPSAASQANAPNVWDRNYVAVYHMSQNPGGTAPQMKDSTSNANNATSNGSMTSGNQVLGQIDGSLSFNGSQYLTAPTSTSLNTLSSSITISAWVNANSSSLSTIFNRIISRNIIPSQDWYIENDGSAPGHLAFYVGSAGPFDFTTALTAGTWDYVVVTGNSSDVIGYLNGSVNKDSGNSAGTIATTGGVGIAADTDSTSPWNGDIDEVRISNIVRSPGWITTEYNNENSPSTFYSLGGVETDIYAPTLDKVLGHMNWFNSEGTEQPFLH